jgi:flagellar motor switch protein FliG
MQIVEINPSKLTGPQKAAIFLLSMGEEFTTSLFKSLDEESIKKVGRYMSEISYIPNEALNVVLSEFLRNFRGDANMAISGRDFLEDVVSRTLDEKTAREVFRAIGSEGGTTPFSHLAYIPSDNLVGIIKAEHPQTIALILSYLPQGKAAEILNLLPEETKADIAFRIVKIGQVQDDIIRDLDEAMRNDLSRVGTATRKFDGVDTLANILNEVDGKTEDFVLSHIEKEDNDLADKIRQKMFILEDLLQVDDRSFREILQNIDNQTLVKALKTASEDLRQKIFSNLSERAADMLKEDMEVVGPVRLKEVEECQQNIIRAAKRLEADGKIVLVGKGEEVFVE